MVIDELSTSTDTSQKSKASPSKNKMSTDNNLLLDAISTNNLPALRALFDAQDRQLYSQVAQTGTPETAAYLLSRHPTPNKECSQYLAKPDPTLNSIQYLVRESARNANALLFRYLLDQYPSLLSNSNKDPRNVERILVNAMTGGVSIWEIILERDAQWMNVEFSGHRGCVLELVVRLGKKELLEMLLKKGADTMRAGDPVLELARAWGADRDMLELIMKYDSRWMECSQEQ